MRHPFNRRRFLGTTGAGAFVVRSATAAQEKPALLGGAPAHNHRTGWPSWPVSDQSEETALLEVLRSGQWFRGGAKRVDEFEAQYARLIGTEHCVATANGTAAIVATLGALDVGPGDEVIVPPYTFIATVNAVLLHHALPVFVDTDPETFLIDATKVEAAITDRTRAILPVHIGGNVADMDTILTVARKHDLPVVEDACQSHLAEWRGKRVGSLGTAGCFSFQVTKNLPSGEGGAITTGDEALAQGCYAFQNNGRPRNVRGYDFRYVGGRSQNLRLTEFQGALLLAQMARTERQSKQREQNAEYLTSLLEPISGITPAKRHEGCTRNAYHLYMLKYDPSAFGGMPRERFLEAMSAEGIPCSGGYGPLNREAFIATALQSRGFRKIYPKEILEGWGERNECPANDALCDRAVWFTQTMFLGPRSDMDDIATAIRKIQANAGALARL